ncbi:SUMF1/EgtB/PvdO family nonheme iron enzyme [Ideonella sp.]|uniref:SUMF1/EgtB/PvdO family nonheme iron enzyme n=1 Tax=Ideonella sp. TaxID=1929293 RepID=UPI0035ADB40A
MQAAPPVPVANAGEPRDWLGYQRYADALWARVVHNFALDSDARSAAVAAKKADGRDLPTGDPLVVGVYGEWGVGKSRLLELMYQLAARQNAEDCAQRVRDPQAYDASPALRLTVPVWFHPWKYEHEPHLAVPLLMHLAEAVQRTLGSAASIDEQARQLLKERGEDLAAGAERLKQAAEIFQAAATVAHKVAGNGLVKTTASLAAGYFGFGAAAERSLSWVEQTAARFLPEAGDGAAKDEKPAIKESKGWFGRTKTVEVVTHATPEASADGRYYYNVHRYLSELTHIGRDTAKRLGHDTLRHDIHLNFVVFVDDLDRCLPEKAVEVLEVIKTVLNVESFAFVIALDDEVIERGISYRYREYRFQNAKPEMPITGFEYLEKIVHLPFRLPQLTRAQAVEFLRRQEERLLAPTASDPAAAAVTPVRLWFVPDPATGELQASPLVHLLLDSFDAFVPRKLGRTLELMHQFQQLFTARGTPIQPAPAGFNATSNAADARMVLCCVLLQLFAPEIFRLLRRRPELFGHWMKAYLEQEQSLNPVFIWQKTSSEQLMTLEVSDADLYRWVALGSGAGTSKLPPRPTDYSKANAEQMSLPFGLQREEWGNYVSRLTSSDRYSVEQVRLPLATALIGFREMQRHAFAPLRLGGAMAYATRWAASDVPRLQEYLNLFSDQLMAASVPAPSPVATSTMIPETAPPAPAASVPVSAAQVSAAAATARPVRQVYLGQLLELLSSDDASTRAALVDRLNLQIGEVVDTGLIYGLAEALRDRGERAIDPRRALEGLALLAPFLPVEAVAEVHDKIGWRSLANAAWRSHVRPGVAEAEALLAFARPVATLGQHGLLAALGLTEQTSGLAGALEQLVRVTDDGETPLPLCSEAADLLGRLGWPRRFEFDERRWGLPTHRAQVRGPGPRPSKPEEEPVLGFVRVMAGEFTMGGSEEVPKYAVRLAHDCFMARTLVTVQQYAAFVAGDGYADETLWEPQGLAWRRGELDAVLAGSAATRSSLHRQQPWRWAEQQQLPTRPMCGVNWFEARAYAAWLQRRLATELKEAGLDGLGVRLPTATEWVRAARAASIDTSDDRTFPWGNGPGFDPPLANLGTVRLGRPTAVGLFPPNPIGIYDLAGNLWEWIDKVFDGPTGGDSPAATISGGQLIENNLAAQREQRGASFADPESFARCDHSRGETPFLQADTVGLRVVLGRPLDPH